MLDDRPEHFRYATDLGRVAAVYPADWEVDVVTQDGGVVRRAIVLGPRLPEVSTDARPQLVKLGWFGARHGQAWALPMARTLGATRQPRGGYVYYDEVGNYRISIDHGGVFEIRDSDGDSKINVIRVSESGGVIELVTPHVKLHVKSDGKELSIESADKLTLHCEGNAELHAGGSVDVRAGTNATVHADADASVTAGGNGTIQAEGDLSLQAGGTITIEAAGTLALTGATIELN